MPKKTSVQGLGSGDGEGSIKAVHRKEKLAIIDPFKNDYNFPFIPLCQSGVGRSTLCKGTQSIFPVKGKGIHFKTYKKTSKLNSCELGRKITLENYLMKWDVSCHENISPRWQVPKTTGMIAPCPQRTSNLSQREWSWINLSLYLFKISVASNFFHIANLARFYFFPPYHWAFSFLCHLCLEPSFLTYHPLPSQGSRCPAPFG